MEKIIEIDGLRFCRDEKTGYYLCSSELYGKRPRLHVYVWEKYHGPVPDGWHVHHKFKNKDTVNVSDLEIMPPGNHTSIHCLERVDEMRAVFNEKVRPHGAAWHKTPEGRRFHRENKHTWGHLVSYAKDKVVGKICEECGDSFRSTVANEKNVRFCSNKCKSRNRRRSGVDDIEAQCPACGKKFMKSKYSKARSCSKKCGGITRRLKL